MEESKKYAVGVRLSLPVDLKAWWDAQPTQEKAKTVQKAIRKSPSFREWEKRMKA